MRRATSYSYESSGSDDGVDATKPIEEYFSPDEGEEHDEAQGSPQYEAPAVADLEDVQGYSPSHSDSDAPQPAEQPALTAPVPEPALEERPAMLGTLPGMDKFPAACLHHYAYGGCGCSMAVRCEVPHISRREAGLLKAKGCCPEALLDRCQNPNCRRPHLHRHRLRLLCCPRRRA